MVRRTAVFRHAQRGGATRYQLRRGERLLGMRINQSVMSSTTNEFELLDVPGFARTRAGAVVPFTEFLDRICAPITAFVAELFRRHDHTAWTMQIIVFVFYTREDFVVNAETGKRVWRTSRTVAYHLSELLGVRSVEHFRAMVWPVMREKIVEEQHNFVNSGSGWQYNYPTAVMMKANQFNPIGRGRRKKRPVHPLPVKLKQRRCLVNVQNEGVECFRYAILSCLAYGRVGKSHCERAYKYDVPWIVALADFSMLTYPVGLDQVEAFERGNVGLAVNVYRYSEREDIFVRQYASMRAESVDENVRVINLLLYKEHYMWISYLSRMLHASNRTKRRVFRCPTCDRACTTPLALQKHARACRHKEAYDMEPQIRMPRAGVNDRLRFTDYSKCLLAPVVVYADCESILAPAEGAEARRENEDEEVHQFAMNTHIPCSVGLKLVCTLDDARTRASVIHFGKDCVAKFLETLKEYEKLVTGWYDNPVPMRTLTQVEQDDYDTASVCLLCNEPLGEAPSQQVDRFRYMSEECRVNATNWMKVRDHCHFTGAFRGAAHSWCNLQAKATYKIPVVMHNFRGYDSHLIMLAGDFSEFKRIKCIAHTLEKYMCVDFARFRFLDSLQFLDESLDVLVQLRNDQVLQQQRENKHDADVDVVASVFPLLASEYTHEPQWKRDLLLRKGVYPYEWVTNWEKFTEKELPPRVAFRSYLRGDYDGTTTKRKAV